MKAWGTLVLVLASVVSVSAQTSIISVPAGGLAPPVIVFPASAVNGGGVVLSPQLLLPDGSAALPPQSWVSASTTGWFRNAQGTEFTVGGTQGPIIIAAATGTSAVTLRSDASLSWNVDGNLSGNLVPDTTLSRTAAGAMQLAQTATTAAEWRVSAGNGSYGGLITVNELLTIAAAATTDSTTTIPAGSIIFAVAVRVTTVIPTAATFTVTAATGGNVFDTAAVAVAAGSTDKGTAAGALYTSAGTKVRITPNLTPGAATGVVRLTIFYFNPNVPAS